MLQIRSRKSRTTERPQRFIRKNFIPSVVLDVSDNPLELAKAVRPLSARQVGRLKMAVIVFNCIRIVGRMRPVMSNRRTNCTLPSPFKSTNL